MNEKIEKAASYALRKAYIDGLINAMAIAEVQEIAFEKDAPGPAYGARTVKFCIRERINRLKSEMEEM